MKIAVIGSGISGLSAAYWLSRESDVQVTLLERGGKLGMDAHRLDFLASDQQTLGVDVPSRMFNSMQWPQLVALYDQIGLPYEPVNASQSFACIADGQTECSDTFLRLDVAFRPDLALRNLLDATPRRVLNEAKRLQELGRHDLDQGIPASLSFGDYLQRNDFSPSFINQFLFPTLSSTVCTCSYQSLRRYPAEIMLAALRRLTDDRALMRTSFGTRDVVSRLTDDRIDVRFNHAVHCVQDTGDGIELKIGDSIRRFDQVIIATQANTALSILPEISDDQRTMLRSFRYEDVDVAVHTDSNLMPRRRKDWSTFNMSVLESADCDEDPAAMCSVWLNRFYDGWTTSQDIFQTISPVLDPNPKSVVARIKLQRPVVDQESVQALQALDEIHQQPDRRIWFCGSWAAKGIPLLETGVVSARTAVDHVLARVAAVR